MDTSACKGYSVVLQRYSISPSRLTTFKDEQGDFKNVTKITSSSRNRKGTTSRRTAFRELINEESGLAMELRPMESSEPSPQRLTQQDHIGRESRAACARLGPVLSEITESFDHDIRGGRVHALNISQRPR